MFFLLFGALSRFVTDEAHILSPSTVTQLEKTLAQFSEKESTQIVVWTTYSNLPIETLSHRVFNETQIGDLHKNNGVLLCIIHNQKQIRIEVGKGLEGKLVDLICGRIIRENIAPYFKDGNYDQGVLKGVHAIMDVVIGEYKSQDPPFDLRGLITGLSLFVMIMIFFFMSSPHSSRGKSPYPIFLNSSKGHGGFQGGGGSSGGGGASGRY